MMCIFKLFLGLLYVSMFIYRFVRYLLIDKLIYQNIQIKWIIIFLPQEYKDCFPIKHVLFDTRYLPQRCRYRYIEYELNLFNIISYIPKCYSRENRKGLCEKHFLQHEIDGIDYHQLNKFNDLITKYWNAVEKNTISLEIIDFGRLLRSGFTRVKAAAQELYLRIIFEKRYAYGYDFGHDLWKLKLKRMIEGKYEIGADGPISTFPIHITGAIVYERDTPNWFVEPVKLYNNRTYAQVVRNITCRMLNSLQSGPSNDITLKIII